MEPLRKATRALHVSHWRVVEPIDPAHHLAIALQLEFSVYGSEAFLIASAARAHSELAALGHEHFDVVAGISIFLGVQVASNRNPRAFALCLSAVERCLVLLNPNPVKVL